MTRRQLGKLAASAALLQRSGKGAPKYSGALDGSEDRVELSSFDSVSYARKLYESAPLELTFRATNRKQAELWQRKLRAKVTELLGGFPSERVPLRAETLEVREFPSYRREKFVFQSKPGLSVLGYLLMEPGVIDRDAGVEGEQFDQPLIGRSELGRACLVR